MQLENLSGEVTADDATGVVGEILLERTGVVRVFDAFLDGGESAFIEVELRASVDLEDGAEAAQLLFPVRSVLGARVEAFERLDVLAREVGPQPAGETLVLGHFVDELFLGGAASVVQTFAVVVGEGPHNKNLKYASVPGAADAIDFFRRPSQ